MTHQSPVKTNAAGVQPAAQPQNAGKASASGAYYSTGRLDVTLLLNHLDLPALVERLGGALRRAGAGYRGRCPIHQGDNPTSFEVYRLKAGSGQAEWRWRCHTRCNAGGDAIELVQRLKGLDFLEAAAFLAEYQGIAPAALGMAEAAASERAQKRLAHDVLAQAARYYAAALQAHPPALATLQQRGFNPETIRQAGWGFSDSGPGLQHFLAQQGADLEQAALLGLLRRDGCDFTANARGKAASPAGYLVMAHRVGERVAYFSARALTPPGQMPDPGDKSRNLPGERQLYWAVAPGDPDLVIVEGPLDAESLRQWGISALALCGLGSIPPDDLERIRRCRSVTLSLDNDLLAASQPTAGEQEARKIRERDEQTQQRLCAQLGPLTLVAANLPHKDWNEALQSGLAAGQVRSLLAGQSSPWIELRIRKLGEAAPTELGALTQEIAAMLQKLDAAAAQRYLTRAAKALGVPARQFARLAAAQAEPESEGVAAVVNGRLHYMGQALGNFQAQIVRELSVSDGVNPPRVEYEIRGSLANGEPLPTLCIEATQFPKLEWVARHWGARVILQVAPSQAFLVGRAIQYVSLPTIRREQLFTYTGWTTLGGQRGFLSASGFLNAAGLDDSILVDLGVNNLKHYSLAAPPVDPQARSQAVAASLDFLRLGPRQVTAPLWAAMFAAPLTEVRPLNAVIAVYGSTQSGKSTITHLALTHFGRDFIKEHGYNAPADWVSTPTALEGCMFLTKDCVMVIDDFAPQFTSQAEAQNIRRAAAYVVRSVGNRSARSRSRADLSQQVTRIPRSLVIMTAEDSLPGQGIAGRMVYVAMQRGDILPDPEKGIGANPHLDDLQQRAQAGLLNQAMSLYIQYLAGHWDEVSSQFAGMVEASGDWARGQGGLQNRLPDAFGVLNAAQRLALNIFERLGLLPAAEASRLAEENQAALLDVIANQAERVAAESPVVKLFTALHSLLAAKKVYLEPRRNPSSYNSPYNAEKIGWYDGDIIYLDTHLALASAIAFYQDLRQNLDISTEALQRQVAQIPGLLSERDSDGRHIRVVKKLGGETRRVLALSRPFIRDRFGLDISNTAAEFNF